AVTRLIATPPAPATSQSFAKSLDTPSFRPSSGEHCAQSVKRPASASGGRTRRSLPRSTSKKNGVAFKPAGAGGGGGGGGAAARTAGGGGGGGGGAFAAATGGAAAAD